MTNYIYGVLCLYSQTQSWILVQSSHMFSSVVSDLLTILIPFCRKELKMQSVELLSLHLMLAFQPHLAFEYEPLTVPVGNSNHWWSIILYKSVLLAIIKFIVLPQKNKNKLKVYPSLGGGRFHRTKWQSDWQTNGLNRLLNLALHMCNRNLVPLARAVTRAEVLCLHVKGSHVR